MLERLEDRQLLATITWDGGPSGTGTDWADPINWVGDVAPGALDDALINAFSGPAIQINGAASVRSVTSAKSLTIAGSLNVTDASVFSAPVLLSGTLSGTGDCTFASALTWTGGVMAGPATSGGPVGRIIINSAGALNISGTTHDLNRILENNGSGVWTAGAIRMSGGTLNNNNQFTASTAGSGGAGLQSFGSAGTNAFNNVGTFTKLGPGEVSFSVLAAGVAFNSLGTIVLQEGMLTLAGGGSMSTPLTVNPGAAFTLGDTYTFTGNGSINGSGEVNFTGGTHSLPAGRFNPTGPVNFSGGTITISTPFTPTALGPIGGNVTFQAALNWAGDLTITGTASFAVAQTFSSLTLSGTLTGAGDITIPGSITWTSGAMTGAGKTNSLAGGTITLSSTGAKVLSRTLNSYGNATWMGGDLGFAAGTFNNNGTFTASSAGTLLAYGNSGTNAFISNGTFTKLGTGETRFTTNVTGAAFNNIGTVSVAAGQLTLGGGGSASAAFNVGAGAVLSIAGNYTFSASGSIAGSGEVRFAGGTINIPAGLFNPTGPVTFSGGTVTINNAFSPASLAPIAGTVTFAQPLAWSGPISISGSVSFSQPQTFSSLTLSGTLTGSGDITVTNALTWVSGSMTGTGRTLIPSGAALTITSGATHTLSRQIVITGSATWNGGGIAFSGGTLTNNGSFLADAQTTLQAYGAGGTNVFNNTGTFTKQGPADALFFAAPAALTLTNTGIITISQGTLAVAAGSTTTPLSVQAGAVLTFTGSFTHNAGGGLSGAGTVNFNSGTHTFGAGQLATTGPLNFNGGTVTINGTFTTTSLGPIAGVVNFNASVSFQSLTLSGTLGGTGDVTVTGATTWIGGTLSGSGRLIIPAGGTLTISTGPHTLSKRIDLSGSGAWTGGDVAFSGGSLHVLSGGVLNINSNAAIQATGSGSGNAITSAGTITKLGLGEVQLVPGAGAVSFTNSGTTTIQEGALTIGGGGATSGIFNVGTGATLRFAADYAYNSGTIGGGGTIAFTAGTHAVTAAAFNPTGTVNFAGGTVTIGNTFAPVSLGDIAGTVTFNGALNYSGALVVSGSVSFAIAQTLSGLTLSGTMTGAGAVTIAGAITWSGGSMTGAGQTIIQPGSTLAINGAAHTLSRTLDVSGTATWTDGGLTLAGGTMIVRAGATLTVTTGATLTATGSTSANALNIQGSLIKAGTGTLRFAPGDFAVAANLLGSLTVQDGVLELAGGSFAGTASVLQPATLSLGGTVTYSSGSLTGAGTIAFAGGTHNLAPITFNPTGAVNLTGGTITIDDSFTPSALGTIGATVTLNAALHWTDAITISGSVAFGTAQSFAQLTLSGTLTGAANITVTNALTWTGGAMSGTGRTIIPQGATLMLSGAAHTLSRTLDLSGTGTWTAGDLSMSGGTFNILAGAVLTADSSSAIAIAGASGANSLNNAGTFTKRGTGALSFTTAAPGVQLFNAGTANIEAGTLSLGAGGSTTGALAVGAGATLTLAASLDYINSGPITGPGTVTFAGGTHIILGNQLAVTGAVNFSAGTITISGSFSPATLGPIGATVTFQSALSYSGALAITGTATFNAPQTFTTLALSGTLSGSGYITVTGSLAWTGGSMSGTGRTIIAQGGNLALSGGAHTLSRAVYVYGTSTWTGGDLSFNGGTFEIQSGAGMTVSTTGTLNVLGPSGDNSFVILTGGMLTKTGTGVLSFPMTGAGVDFTNAGTVHAQTGSVSLGYVTNYTSNTLTGGTWIIQNVGFLNFPTGTQIYTNRADIRMYGINSSFGALIPLSTNAGSLILADGRLATFSPLGNLFTNTGTLIKAGSGSSTFASAITFNNSGTITVSGGTLTLAGPISQVNGATLTGGSWNVSGGAQLVFPGMNLTVSHAAILISGAGSSFTAVAGLRTNMGSFTITGGKTFSTPSFTNLGKLTIGPGSTLTVTGTFDNSFYFMNHGGHLTAAGGGNSMGPFWFFQGASMSLSGTHAFASTATIIGAGSLAVTGGSSNFAGSVALEGTLNISGGSAAFSTDIYFSSAVNTGGLYLGRNRMSLTGVYTQGSAGVLNVEMGSDTSYGRINAGGAVTLSGRVNVTWGYTPEVGVIFNFLTGAARVGVFSSATLGSLDGRVPQLQYEPGGVSLIIQPV